MKRSTVFFLIFIICVATVLSLSSCGIHEDTQETEYSTVDYIESVGTTEKTSSIPVNVSDSTTTISIMPEGTVYISVYDAEIPVCYDFEVLENSLLSKYYISSAENVYKELEEDFERKLIYLPLVDLGDEANSIRRESIRAANDVFAEHFSNECKTMSAEMNLSLEDYLRQNYFKLPFHYADSPVEYGSEQYYRYFTGEYVKLRYTVLYLAEVWGIESNAQTDQGNEEAELEALKKAVFDYSVANSEIVYDVPDVKSYITKKELWDSVSADESLLHEIYVDGENGYAAVYRGWFVTREDDLEPYAGERICGTVSFYGIHRIVGYDGWEYLLEIEDSGYMMLKFDRWVLPDSQDYEAYKIIYGKEPLIKQ